MQPTKDAVRYVALLVTLFSVAAFTVAAEPNAAKQKEQQLIAILKSDVPASEKAVPCKLLAVYGTAEAVPALAPLLGDERLASWARIALEAIPGPEADKALRDAVATQKGRLLIGAINSLGVRGDVRAVALLSSRLKADETQVAAAAALALGRIGNDKATKALRQSLRGGTAEVRSAVAEGCILCAERLLAANRAIEAAKLYDAVRSANVSKQRIVEATRGAILARKSDGIPLLIEQLKSDDRDFFRIGLSAARELPGREVAEALAAELVGLKPQRSALLVRALADRKDAVVTPAMLHAARSGSKSVRLAVIGLIQRAGDATCVPTLLEVALANDEELARAAGEALANLPGDNVNAEIKSRLPTAKGKTLALLIQVVGERRISATPDLLKYVDHGNANIRRVTLRALGETVGPDHLAVLIVRVAKPKHAEDAVTVQRALRSACVRMPDRETCAAQLTAAMSGSPVESKVAYLEILGAMGGTKALRTIHASAKGAVPQLQDAGTRVLGKWMSLDAAPVLMDLAQTMKEQKYRVRALRGYIRLARQFSMPPTQRAKMSQQALRVAVRPEEQQLVFQVLQRYPHIATLRVAVEAAEKPKLKDDATRVALAISQKLGGQHSEVQKLLTQIGQEPVKLEIIRARYGAGSKQKDVTKLLRKHAGGLRLIALPSPSYNASFGGDPAPGIVKQLQIEYRINGKAGKAVFKEDATIILAVPK